VSSQDADVVGEVFWDRGGIISKKTVHIETKAGEGGVVLYLAMPKVDGAEGIRQ